MNAPVPNEAEVEVARGATGRITDAYARQVARAAYLWAWPMVNMVSRRLQYADVPAKMYVGGAPLAPLNELAMLTDYLAPEVRAVACPNQDVVYGAGLLALDHSPVVIQVPDFGDRFWVYQVVDSRTDTFVELGTMYGTPPGFYLLVGPDWRGEAPAAIARVFRASTRTGVALPRVYVEDTADDKARVQAVLRQIAMYPLDRFDGAMKTIDWRALPVSPARGHGDGETQWVVPARFFDLLPSALADAPARPDEEALYAQALTVLAAANADRALRAVIDDEAARADAEVVSPLFEFRNWGEPLPFHWSTVSNTAAFGMDYVTRTAVARSNIFVNAARETRYFYQDLDSDGERLNGGRAYRIAFKKDQTPPVDGFWSLTLYNAHHFFAPNAIGRYSIGSNSRGLVRAPDGSLTIYIQSEEPADPAKRANWLPAPGNADFSLYIRAYGPKAAITAGRWTPPAVTRI